MLHPEPTKRERGTGYSGSDFSLPFAGLRECWFFSGRSLLDGSRERGGLCFIKRGGKVRSYHMKPWQLDTLRRLFRSCPRRNRAKIVQAFHFRVVEQYQMNVWAGLFDARVR